MRRPLVVLGLLLHVSAAALVGEGRRLVAVGDIHGAFEAFRSILIKAGLVDREENWSGGDTILVQTGDFLDRGADSIRVALWLMELQGEAAEVGGEVVVLMGNHESMNLMGDDRYISAEMLEPMVNEDSQERRAQMCKQHALILRQSAKTLKRKAPSAATLRKACIEDHPLGWVEYQEALRPEGALGGWMRTLPVAVLLEGTLFVHGGWSADLSAHDLDEVNRKARQEIENFDLWRRWLIEADRMVASANLVEMAHAVQAELDRRDRADEAGEQTPSPGVPNLAEFFDMSQHLLLSQDGPLWFRGYNAWSEEEGLAEIEKILSSLGACRVVVGHTPQNPRRIRSRFAGQVFLIDTGMLEEYYDGVPAALDIKGERVEAIYLDQERVVLSSRPCDLAEEHR